MLIQKDIRDAINDLPDKCYQAIITSPPFYRQRDYGSDQQLGQEETPEQYIDNLVNLFIALREKMTSTGLLWINLGDCYAARATSRYGDKGHGKNNPRLKQLRKIPENMKHKDLMGLPWEFGKKLRDEGFYLRSMFPWIKTNVVTELAAQDRFANTHEYWLMLSISEQYYWNKQAVREHFGKNWNSEDFFSLSTHILLNNLQSYVEHVRKIHESGLLLGSQERVLAYLGNTNKKKLGHYAAYSEEMIKPLVLASTKPGDHVLDPFCGTGTTGLAALKLGCHFTGVELMPHYAEIAKEQLSNLS